MSIQVPAACHWMIPHWDKNIAKALDPDNIKKSVDQVTKNIQLSEVPVSSLKWNTNFYVCAAMNPKPTMFGSVIAPPEFCLRMVFMDSDGYQLRSEYEDLAEFSRERGKTLSYLSQVHVDDENLHLVPYLFENRETKIKNLGFSIHSIYNIPERAEKLISLGLIPHDVRKNFLYCTLPRGTTSE